MADLILARPVSFDMEKHSLWTGPAGSMDWGSVSQSVGNLEAARLISGETVYFSLDVMEHIISCRKLIEQLLNYALAMAHTHDVEKAMATGGRYE